MNNENKIVIIPRTVDECVSLSEQLSKSTLLPLSMRGKAADVQLTIMAGQELGLPPATALRLIHVIDGKPILSADGMVALILGSGKAKYFERVEQSETSVTYETLREGAKSPQRCTWTMDMAKKAALHQKDNWRTYPRAMLASRAKAELARDVYPDVLAGVYSPEEAQDFTAPTGPTLPARRSDNSDAIDAEIVNETNGHSDDATLTAIDAAPTVDALKALVPTIRKLKSGALDDARKRYDARLAQLEQGTAA